MAEKSNDLRKKPVLKAVKIVRKATITNGCIYTPGSECGPAPGP